jgi:Cu/Ag efflux protein CusF
MKFKSFIAACAILAAGVSAPAQTDSSTAVDMSQGEVRKVDKENKKITLKHAEIKNLEMPGMTMVFQVKDAALLDTVKPGDKVQFKAEKAGGALVITDIQIAR